MRPWARCSRSKRQRARLPRAAGLDGWVAVATVVEAAATAAVVEEPVMVAAEAAAVVVAAAGAVAAAEAVAARRCSRLGTWRSGDRRPFASRSVVRRSESGRRAPDRVVTAAARPALSRYPYCDRELPIRVRQNIVTPAWIVITSKRTLNPGADAAAPRTVIDQPGPCRWSRRSVTF